MTDWQQIAEHISKASGKPFSPNTPETIGGGCINTTVRLGDGRHSYFIKLNHADRLEMFEAESAGLAELAATHSIRIPKPICHGIADNQAYLAMEYIAFGRPKNQSAEQAGRQLATMHRTTQAQFGWHRDNTIGSTPQPNRPHDDWISFWHEQRLGFQLQLAAHNGYSGRLQRRGEKLLDKLALLIDHSPPASLLHGDLWGGNLAYDLEGLPVIYDPAVYYGDREADLAMTELFGGFSQSFYAAYQEAWPLDPGYHTRKELYNLYHILNHLNLFGGGYLAQAQSMTEHLLGESG
ncbi:fructosamine kinase family protein [Pseudomonadota bacterium]